MEDALNMLECEIIEHLGRFGFLTCSQFQLLTGKSGSYIREMLGSLRKKGYVRSFRNAISKAVHTENMYVNTARAVEFLISHKNIFSDDIKTTTTTSVVRDFFHRFCCTSVSIFLWQFLTKHSIPVNLMSSYFDKVGNPQKGTLVAKIAIPIGDGKILIPDIVFKTGSALYLIEMYCDKDSKRIINQLSGHAKAIALGSPAAKFNIPNTNPFVLAVFEHPATRQAVIKRLAAMEGFHNMSHLYFFANLDDVKTDIETAFTTINNIPLSFT